MPHTPKVYPPSFSVAGPNRGSTQIFIPSYVLATYVGLDTSISHKICVFEYCGLSSSTR